MMINELKFINSEEKIKFNTVISIDNNLHIICNGSKLYSLISKEAVKDFKENPENLVWNLRREHLVKYIELMKEEELISDFYYILKRGKLSEETIAMLGIIYRIYK